MFGYTRNPIRQINTKAAHAALYRVGTEDFRWRDLRHTWVSLWPQQSTPLRALQALGGWESPEMVRRYAHFLAEHLAPYPDRLCRLWLVD